ncbi:MAG: Calx-beta domain-containing protein [Paraglaciecola sp.]|uniref:Calx-beta domain-containing protein n=1 Tax=Paraglaciecola sp. TaxID=1920173 RepID=UPI003297F672
MRVFIVLVGLFSSVSILAESFPPQYVFTQQQSSSDSNFTYPELSLLETEVTSHDILFFYTHDMLDYFDNDVEELVTYVQESVDFNNASFQRQNIPLSRNIAGIVRIPETLSYDDQMDGEERLNALKRVYSDETYNFNRLYDASYVVALNRHYPDIVNNIGLAYVGGQFSWVSPYRLGKPDRTLSHELGHNDGFTHDEEAANKPRGSGTIADILQRRYAIGESCGTHDSIMKSGSGSRDEGFFSSPLVFNEQQVKCGREDIADSARAYIEAASNEIPARTGSFRNNKPSPVKTGSVGISLPSQIISEGSKVAIELFWTGAEVGDSVQLLTRKGTADFADFKPTLTRAYYDGENTTSVIEINTVDDDIFEFDETFTVELLYPRGIHIEENAVSKEVIITSEDYGEPGRIGFEYPTLLVQEGETKNIRLVRTGGTDGALTVLIKANLSTASDNDFYMSHDTLMFAQGEQFKTLSITAISDNLSESTEEFSLELIGEAQFLANTRNINITLQSKQKKKDNSESGGGSLSIIAMLMALILVVLRRFHVVNQSS